MSREEVHAPTPESEERTVLCASFTEIYDYNQFYIYTECYGYNV